MIALAIDTAGMDCAACLFDSSTSRVISQKCETIGRGHAERLMVMIEEIMAEAKMPYQDIGRIVTSVGPGSFAGIRVGVASAKGLALGLGVDAVGVSNLDAILAASRSQLPEGALIGAVVEAGRGNIYSQFNFDSEFALANEPFLATAEDLAIAASLRKKQLYLAGNAAGSLGELSTLALVLETDSGDVSLIATIAALGVERDPASSPPSPLYLRQPDAKVSSGFAVERVK